MATTTKVIPALPEATIATGDIIYYDTDEFQKVSVSTAGKVLTTVAGKPAWVEPSAPTTFYCILEKQADQAITGNSTVTFGAGSEIYDAEGMHDTSTNTERITIPAGEGGLYLIGASVRWDNDTSGGRQMNLKFYDNSAAATKTLHYTVNDSAFAYAGPATISAIYALDENDYVYLWVSESSAGTPDVRAGTSFWVYRLQT